MTPEAPGPPLGRLPSVEAEARGLLSLVAHGEDVAQVRELIGVPTHLEARLRQFGSQSGNAHIFHVLKFRSQVLAAFERLLATASTASSSAGWIPKQD